MNIFRQIFPGVPEISIYPYDFDEYIIHELRVPRNNMYIIWNFIGFSKILAFYVTSLFS